MANTFSFEYVNYIGKWGLRTVDLARTHKIWWGRTEHHPIDQWLFTAFDVDKQANRTYALINIAATHNGMVIVTGGSSQEVDEHCGYTPDNCPYGDACADCGKVK